MKIKQNQLNYFCQQFFGILSFPIDQIYLQFLPKRQFLAKLLGDLETLKGSLQKNQNIISKKLSLLLNSSNLLETWQKFTRYNGFAEIKKNPGGQLQQKNIRKQGSNYVIRDRELRIVFCMCRIKHNTSAFSRIIYKPYVPKKIVRFLKLTKLRRK